MIEVYGISTVLLAISLFKIPRRKGVHNIPNNPFKKTKLSVNWKRFLFSPTNKIISIYFLIKDLRYIM